jgi:choline dehydrogenase-like flavoprotein
MTLRPFSVVRHLTVDGSSRKVTGVHVIDSRTREPIEFRARIVFLCASALESARILLNSRDSQAPNGLANSSDQVGRNVMDHIKWGGADGQFDGWTDKQVLGARPNGIYIPRFRNVRSPHQGFVRGYGFQGAASRQGWQTRVASPGIGLALKQRLTDLGPWVMTLNGFGEMLPNAQNRCTPHPTAVDAWGIPVLHIDCAWGPNERAIHKDMNVSAAEMLERAGAKNIRPSARISTPGNTNHEMGTARMGRDRKTSVLNRWNQAWDAPNLFVTDGACMTSSGNQNPSLTYMALTARACHYAVEEMRRGNL